VRGGQVAFLFRTVCADRLKPLCVPLAAGGAFGAARVDRFGPRLGALAHFSANYGYFTRGVYLQMEVLTDPCGALPALWGFDIGKGAVLRLDHHRRPIHHGGTVYILHDGTKIIAPDNWP